MYGKIKTLIWIFILFLVIFLGLWQKAPIYVLGFLQKSSGILLIIFLSTLLFIYLIRKKYLRGRHKDADHWKVNRINEVASGIEIQQQLKYQAYLLENIQESIIICNIQGEIIYINPQGRNTFAASEDSLVSGRELMGRIIPYDQDKLKEIIDTVTSGTSWQKDFRLQVNSESRVFRHRIDPLKENGQVSALIIISTDITELIESREQAKLASLAKSQFLANMSHEIRTPMIGILGAVDLLEQSHLNHVQMDNLQIIRVCGEQLLAIINDILDVSKIEVGLVTINPEPCNLLDVIRRTVNIIEPMLKEKGLQFTLDLDPLIPNLIMLDKIKIHQVLMNLLHNAVKFTHRGAISLQVTILTPDKQNVEYLKISVNDTGIGIPAEQLENIFNPFTQVDNSYSRSYGGTGLGLYICYSMIGLMKGTLQVQSHLGEGTTFSFEVPLVPFTGRDKTDHLTNMTKPTEIVDNLCIGFSPLQVLLVEDNELNRKIVGQMLSNYGFEVTAVGNGLECLQILDENTFDTVLMDMQMPIMDGYEATRLIHENHLAVDTPIIAMTANAMNGDREKCLAAGCTSYIAKPFKAEELVQEIRNHLPLKLDNKNRKNRATNDLIAELLPEFLEQLSELTKQLSLAVENKDLTTVKSISHDIKGTAGMYGFTSISKVAADIEFAAREHSWVKVTSHLEQLYNLQKRACNQVG
ncbi:response regulator [Syntrophomonas erecta]